MDILNIDDRKTIIDHIDSKQNEKRKAISLKDYRVFMGNFDQYVFEKLLEQFSKKTAEETPRISCINVAKRVIKEKAAVYRDEPTRRFEGLTEDQEEKIREIYSVIDIDTILRHSNEIFKIQSQNLLQLIPVEKELKLRTLWGHHYDAVPDYSNPELAKAYIITGFDRDFYLRDYDYATPTGNKSLHKTGSTYDYVNQKIADKEDYKSKNVRMSWWSNDANFITNKKGVVISVQDNEYDTENILGEMPFIDVANIKDYAYFVEAASCITDFCIDFNHSLSVYNHLVRLQGHAQAYLKGPKDLLPESVQIGPNYILKLAIDPNNPVPTEFGFANPGSDLRGARENIETILSSFLTSEGLDPSIVNTNGSTTIHNSGIERLLSMIQQFSASKSDFSTYRRVEEKIFDLVLKWCDILGQDPEAADYYNLGVVSKEARIEVEFAEPQMIQTESERLDNIRKKVDLIQEVMESMSLSKDEALEMLRELEEEF